MMSATIRDVAKRANVGIGTVSRVLNNNPAVSAETRQRVLAAIEELEYIPNPVARQLSTGRSLTISVILPYLTLPSYIERLRGVQHVLASNEYDLVLYSVGSVQQRDAYFHSLAQRSRADGILIISLPPNQEQAHRFIAAGVPTVLVDADHPDICSITSDDSKGGQLATQHLIDLGHQKIAFLSDHLSTPFHPSMRYRFHGYCKALEQNQIVRQQKYQVEGHTGREDARRMARSLLTLDDPPTAIFAASDTHAIGVLDAAQELNINVPADLSVIGYDGIRDAEYLSITTVEQHLYESGTAGASQLLKIIAQGNNAHCNQVLPIELTIRNTTAPPRQ
jgi:DNA-binding LacI/PurR family transcriptional regulator